MRKIFKNFIDSAFDYSPHISTISVITLTVIDISGANALSLNLLGLNISGETVYYLSIGLTCLFSLVTFSRNKSVLKLETALEKKDKKIDQLFNSVKSLINDSDELFNLYLKLVITNLEFSPNDRISVFKKIDDKFILLGRSSTNPKLIESGRDTYSTNEGFISKAWENGLFFIENLPSPKSHINEYIKKTQNLANIGKKTIRNIPMKSRTYYIQRVDSLNGIPTAIIVCESKAEKAFDIEFLESTLSQIKRSLIMFVEKNNKHQHLNLIK